MLLLQLFLRLWVTSLKNKKIILEVIVICIIVLSVGIYISSANDNYKSLNFNISKENFINPCNISMTIHKNTMNIVSNKNITGSWSPINSKPIAVKAGMKILLQFKAEYKDTAQTSVRIIGNDNTSNVLGYGMIVQGTSNWRYYSEIISIPQHVNSITIQILIGWIYGGNTEGISFQDMSLNIIE